MTKTVLVLGSAHDALRARDFDSSKFDAIIAINNAWRIRDDWTHLIHAGDFPDRRKPVAAKDRKILSYEAYVPANNVFGGIVYAGGTMAFSAAYWALQTLQPDVLSFCGCDMVYNQTNGRSHFYGRGKADPLRIDPTLQSLEAKANRLMLLALDRGCLCINLSELPESRLTFPRASLKEVTISATEFKQHKMDFLIQHMDYASMATAKLLEKELNCFVSDGDYWNYMGDIQSKKLAEIDQAWLRSYKNPNILEWSVIAHTPTDRECDLV